MLMGLVGVKFWIPFFFLNKNKEKFFFWIGNKGLLCRAPSMYKEYKGG
jgi:hypothetical protein